MAPGTFGVHDSNYYQTATITWNEPIYYATTCSGWNSSDENCERQRDAEQLFWREFLQPARVRFARFIAAHLRPFRAALAPLRIPAARLSRKSSGGRFSGLKIALKRLR